MTPAGAIAGLAALAVVCASGAAYLAASWHAERSRRTWFEGLAREREAMLRDGLREAAARHADELARVVRAHDAERRTWQEQAQALGAMMRSAVGVAAFGGQPTTATVRPQPPDAEARLNRRIQEETIQAGIAAITADYKAQGLAITEEEAREQAIAFLNGDLTPVFGERA